MAIQISGTTVITNTRELINVTGVGNTSTTIFYGDGSNLSGVPSEARLFFISAR